MDILNIIICGGWGAGFHIYNERRERGIPTSSPPLYALCFRRKIPGTSTREMQGSQELDSEDNVRENELKVKVSVCTCLSTKATFFWKTCNAKRIEKKGVCLCKCYTLKFDISGGCNTSRVSRLMVKVRSL